MYDNAYLIIVKREINEIIYANFLAPRKYSKTWDFCEYFSATLLSLNLWTLFHEFQCGVNVQDSFGISEEWGQLSSSCVTWANVLVSQNLPF